MTPEELRSTADALFDHHGGVLFNVRDRAATALREYADRLERSEPPKMTVSDADKLIATVEVIASSRGWGMKEMLRELAELSGSVRDKQWRGE